MGSSVPKRHHYIPQMLLKRFCTDNGLIWVHDGRKTYETHYWNVFVKRHLNTRSEFDNTPRGASYKDFLNSVQKEL